MASSPLTPLSPMSPGREVVFESYLHKTPPLDKLFVKWKKRYFVLTRNDPFDQSSIELAYYNDKSAKVKRGTINLSKFVGIRPNAKIGNKDNIFAIETEERKYILRAPDAVTKNIWLAKLCELCGQEQVYHVTVPSQPSAQVGEGIIKLSSPKSALVISPTTGRSIMEVPFKDVRRIGCMMIFNYSLVWFETCQSCKSNQPDLFYFFLVSSGLANAQIITKDLKSAIERCSGAFMIMESDQYELSYISRNHYGCPLYPMMARNNIIQRALSQFGVSYACPKLQTTIRRDSDPVMAVGVSLEEYAANKPSRRTFSVSSSSNRPLTKAHSSIGRLRKESCSSFGSQNSLEMEGSDRRTPLETFDPTFSPKRKLSQKDSLSSHSSTNSGPFSPTIAEEEEVDRDEVEEAESIQKTNMSNLQRLARSGNDLHMIGRPFVPPRSRASLLHNQLKKRSNTVHGL